MIDFKEFHKWKDLEFSVIEAYDCGQYSYEDAYRHCYKIACSLSFGWW